RASHRFGSYSLSTADYCPEICRVFQRRPSALVLAAIDAGNLKEVSTGARNKWPDTEIVVCADADDIGREKGRAAAIAAGALLAIPEFPAGAEGSDYNDLANLAAQEVDHV
ncbi:hypothetical protein ACS8YF_12625, partial [Salinisphaera sp. SWV1]